MHISNIIALLITSTYALPIDPSAEVSIFSNLVKRANGEIAAEKAEKAAKQAERVANGATLGTAERKAAKAAKQEAKEAAITANQAAKNGEAGGTTEDDGNAAARKAAKAAKKAKEAAKNSGAGGGQAVPRPKANDTQCSDLLTQATGIVTAMETIIKGVKQRNPISANGQNLTDNLNDLATYEDAVSKVDPIFNQAVACNGAVDLNVNRYLVTRADWFQVKSQIRTAQINAGVADGKSAL